MNRVVGLGGYARSGKGAVASILERHGWYRTFMSKPLHEAMLALDPIVFMNHWDDTNMRYSELIGSRGYEKAKAEFSEVRRLLQVLGTEVGRKILGEDTWIDVIEAELADAWVADPNQPQVITGIRFPNEIDMIRSLGGDLIWVERPGFGPANGHSSEQALDIGDFDYTLVNGGDLAGLEEIVQRALVDPDPDWLTLYGQDLIR